MCHLRDRSWGWKWIFRLRIVDCFACFTRNEEEESSLSIFLDERRKSSSSIYFLIPLDDEFFSNRTRQHWTLEKDLPHFPFQSTNRTSSISFEASSFAWLFLFPRHFLVDRLKIPGQTILVAFNIESNVVFWEILDEMTFSQTNLKCFHCDKFLVTSLNLTSAMNVTFIQSFVRYIVSIRWLCASFENRTNLERIVHLVSMNRDKSVMMLLMKTNFLLRLVLLVRSVTSTNCSFLADPASVYPKIDEPNEKNKRSWPWTLQSLLLCFRWLSTLILYIVPLFIRQWNILSTSKNT